MHSCALVGVDGHGILLYTSGSGSEGTLGGLVCWADRIEYLIADVAGARYALLQSPVLLNAKDGE